MKEIRCLNPNPVVVLREESDDRAILFNPDTGKAVGINPVGVSIWKNLNGRIDIEGMALRVEEVFTNVPDTVSEEISAF